MRDHRHRHPPRPRGRRRAEHRRRRLHGPALPGLRPSSPPAPARGALAAGRRFKPGPDGARRDAPRHGGLRRRPAARRPARPRPDHLPHRPRRDGGQGPRAHARRRRLRHQAVQPRGARRADPLDPAPLRPRAARLEPAGVRGHRARRGRARGHPRRRADRPDGDRVPAAALPDAQPAPRADPRAAARARLGLRLRRRRARAGDLRELPAQQARPARPAADPHRARRRLRPASPARRDGSLRARLVAGLLALAAVGLLLARRRSRTPSSARSCCERVDEQARAAPARVSRSSPTSGSAAPRPAPAPATTASTAGRGGGGAPASACPPGTYGEQRDASGTVLGDDRPRLRRRSTAAGARAAAPTSRWASRSPSTRRGGERAALPRRSPQPDRDDGGIIVAAVPLREVDQTLAPPAASSRRS